MTPEERAAKLAAEILRECDRHDATPIIAAAIREAVKAERDRTESLLDAFRAGFVSGMLDASREEDPLVKHLVRCFAAKAEAQFETLAAAIRARTP